MGHTEDGGNPMRAIDVARTATIVGAMIGLCVSPIHPAASAAQDSNDRRDELHSEMNTELNFAQRELALSGYVEMVVQFPEIETEPDKGLSSFINAVDREDDEGNGIQATGTLATKPIALVRVTSSGVLQNLFSHGMSAVMNRRIPVPDERGGIPASGSEPVDPSAAIGADWARSEYGLTGAGARIFVVGTGASNGNLSDTQACFSQNQVDQYGNLVTRSACPSGAEVEIGPNAGRACSAPGCGHEENVVAVNTDVAPGAEIFPIQVTTIGADGRAFISYFSLLRALEYVAGRSDLGNTDILQLSLAYRGYSGFCNAYEPDLAPLIGELIARGVLVIDGTGNDNDTAHKLDGVVPATACIVNDPDDLTADGKLTVGALNGVGDGITDYTQLGPSVRMGGYDPVLVDRKVLSGNSFMVPQAGGLAALLMEVDLRRKKNDGFQMGPREREGRIYSAGKPPIKRGRYDLRGLDAAEAVKRRAIASGVEPIRSHKVFIPLVLRQ